jgi:hypothetical protein
MFTDLSEVLVASIIRAMMIEATSTSETSVNYQTTRRCNPEVSHLHIRRRENLKSYFAVCYYSMNVLRIPSLPGSLV